jgi:hypothetical protein
VIVRPSFTAEVTYLVCPHGAELLGVRITADDEAPDVDEVAVSRTAFGAILRSLEGKWIPAAPGFGHMGLDGTRYTLRLRHPPNVYVSYDWWGSPPPGWEPLGDVARGIVDMIDAAIDGIRRR